MSATILSCCFNKTIVALICIWDYRHYHCSNTYYKSGSPGYNSFTVHDYSYKCQTPFPQRRQVRPQTRRSDIRRNEWIHPAPFAPRIVFPISVRQAARVFADYSAFAKVAIGYQLSHVSNDAVSSTLGAMVLAVGRRSWTLSDRRIRILCRVGIAAARASYRGGRPI